MALDEEINHARVTDKTVHLVWECERCGKLIPYMAVFCHDCADELLGEPPKPFDPQENESEEINKG